jgi:rubredoxin
MPDQPFFTLASGGLDSNLPAHTRFECKICWTVYDPAIGDPIWQIPPGTAFALLPDHWRCPICDAAKSDFLVLNDLPQ